MARGSLWLDALATVFELGHPIHDVAIVGEDQIATTFAIVETKRTDWETPKLLNLTTSSHAEGKVYAPEETDQNNFGPS